MICLVDNDVTYKLAMCNLLDDSLAALDLARTDTYVLPTAKYKFGVARKRPSIGERRYGAEVFARIWDFLGNARGIRRRRTIPLTPTSRQYRWHRCWGSRSFFSYGGV